MKMQRKSRREALVSHDRWLVSYADFITLLFALFVVLFAASRHSGQSLERVSHAIHNGFGTWGSMPMASPAQAWRGADPETALEQQLATVLHDSLAHGAIEMHHSPQGLVISLQELGFFNSGEAALLPGAADKIEQIGRLLMSHGVVVRVEGHSDNQPIHNASFHSNWELSAARAMTVLLLLVDDAHYDPTRISMAGYGPYRPISDNATAAGRQRNRRVDLVVLGPSR